MAENYDNDDYDLPTVPLAKDIRLPGYKLADCGMSMEDLRCGYSDLEGELDLNDMFGAFQTPNHGLVGGAKTVDDFTPDGLSPDPIGGSAGTIDKSGSPSQRYP